MSIPNVMSIQIKIVLFFRNYYFFLLVVERTDGIYFTKSDFSWAEINLEMMDSFYVFTIDNNN